MTPSELGETEYLGYRLLEELEECKGLVPRSLFFKIWCVTDRYLESEYQYDSGLPRYWYRYGEIVDEHSMPTFYNAPSAPWGGQAYSVQKNVDEADFEISSENKEVSEKGVKWAIERFGGKDTEYVKKHQYKAHSPNEFIRTYSELRDILQSTDLASQSVLLSSGGEYNNNKELVEDFLDQMIVAYPEEEGYDEIYDNYLRWDDTARLLLEDEPQYEELDRSLDSFIEALSQHVLQFKYNSNIPIERIERWEGEKGESMDEFMNYLESQRDVALSGRRMSGELESIAEVYDATVTEAMENMEQ